MSNEITDQSNQELSFPDRNKRIIPIDKAANVVNIPAIIGHLAQYANLASIAGTIKKGNTVYRSGTHTSSGCIGCRKVYDAPWRRLWKNMGYHR